MYVNGIAVYNKQIDFVVFLSPEVLELPAWRKVLSNKTFNDRLAIVAVDEAHCIAEWLVVTRRVA